MSRQHRSSRPEKTTGSLGTCVEHGKRLYTSRKAARKAAKRHLIGEHVNAYRCDEQPAFYHFGHLPKIVQRGLATRDQLAPTRPRVPQRFGA